jgi:hypothetical protein
MVMPQVTSTSPAPRHAEPAPAAIPPGVALLRVLAPACRAKARLDLFQACAMLSLDRDQAAQAYAEALVRTLAQGLGRLPVLHRAGTAELSFDEAWLAALFAARARGDDDSFTFLTRRRLARGAARQIGFLVAALAARLPV